jgi:hypothetical protein
LVDLVPRALKQLDHISTLERGIAELAPLELCDENVLQARNRYLDIE